VENAGPLVYLPCLDSAAQATRCRASLAIPRERAKELGLTAVMAAASGYYLNARGEHVDWSQAVARAIAAKISLPPEAALPATPPVRAVAGAGESAKIAADLTSSDPAHLTPPAAARPQPGVTRVQVANETTLVAARRLQAAGQRVLALNFANGVQPGGGFLNGARAQEEGLCRSSALHATLHGDPMYQAHRQRPLADSSDWAILSPRVPVFRADDGTPEETPWELCFLTCAAPYAPHLGQPRAGDLLRQRIHRVLAIAAAYGYPALVLGAWGCGAFGNNPARTARDFHAALAGDFAGAFAEVVFAIADWSPERQFLGAFAAQFRPGP
jgi:uncharacterized protein (TIGR02452 family)